MDKLIFEKLGKKIDLSKREDEIKKTMVIISEIWNRYPQLRLCQLIGNCFYEKDLYYIEDDALREHLKETYGKTGLLN